MNNDNSGLNKRIDLLTKECNRLTATTAVLSQIIGNLFEGLHNAYADNSKSDIEEIIRECKNETVSSWYNSLLELSKQPNKYGKIEPRDIRKTPAFINELFTDGSKLNEIIKDYLEEYAAVQDQLKNQRRRY